MKMKVMEGWPANAIFSSSCSSSSLLSFYLLFTFIGSFLFSNLSLSLSLSLLCLLYSFFLCHLCLFLFFFWFLGSLSVFSILLCSMCVSSSLVFVFLFLYVRSLVLCLFFTWPSSPLCYALQFILCFFVLFRSYILYVFLLFVHSANSSLFLFLSVPVPPPAQGCLCPAFIRPETAPVVITVGSNGVGRSIQWRSVSTFNGRAVAEEEDERTVACKTTPFSNSKGCFQFGPWNSCNFAIKPLIKM
jgi:hypothetical protein